MPEPLAVTILAGGSSRRMGRDKALLRWGSATLLEAMLAIARKAGAGEISISGLPERYGRFGVPCLADLRSGCGPLAGIATALALSPAPRRLVLGCDMPLVPPELLRWLWGQPLAEWVVPESEPGRLEPLCAIYSRALLPAIEAAMAEGRFKIELALAGAPRRIVSAPALAAAGFSPAVFRNLNRPEDYAVVKPSRA